MFRQSATPIVSRVLADDLLNALSARPAAAILSAPKVMLLTNPGDLPPGMVIGDLVEATFGGYAAVNLPVLAGPENLDSGNRGVHGDVNFAADNTISGLQHVTGYAVVDGTGAILYTYERFTDPVSFFADGDFLDLAVQFAEPYTRVAE